MTRRCNSRDAVKTENARSFPKPQLCIAVHACDLATQA